MTSSGFRFKKISSFNSGVCRNVEPGQTYLLTYCYLLKSNEESLYHRKSPI